MREAMGLSLIDPERWVGEREKGAEPERERGHVALVLPDHGPPAGVYLGEVLTFETWTSERIRPIPPWLSRHIPAVFWPACAWSDRDERAIWLIRVNALIEMGDLDRGFEETLLSFGERANKATSR